VRAGVFYSPIENKIVLIKKLDIDFKYGTLYMFQDSKSNIEVMTKWRARDDRKKLKYVGRF
jgi:hypothetical protein